MSFRNINPSETSIEKVEEKNDRSDVFFEKRNFNNDEPEFNSINRTDCGKGTNFWMISKNDMATIVILREVKFLLLNV